MAECVICWEIYEEGTKCPKLLPCNHTFCISCLEKILNLEGNGKMKCPYCRTLHQIPGGYVQNLPTNRRLLKEATRKKSEIYTLPSSGNVPRTDNGICEQHGNPSHSIIYNVFDGTLQRFCETCLNPDSCIVSVQDSAAHTGEESNHQQSPRPRNDDATHSENRRNYAETYEESEVVLRPNYLTTQQFRWQEIPNHWVQNMEQTEIFPWQPGHDSNRIWIMESQWPPSQDNWRTSTSETSKISLSKILKRLVFILLSPIIVSIGIVIALVTTVLAFIMGLCYATYHCFFDDDVFNVFPELTNIFIVDFVTVPFKRYEYVITKMFCFGDEVSDRRFISKFCQGAITVVKAAVIFVVASAFGCIVVPISVVIAVIAYSIWMILICPCLCMG